MKRVGEGWMIDAVHERLDGWQRVEIDGQIHRFAAGEFSNCIWGFYLEKN